MQTIYYMYAYIYKHIYIYTHILDNKNTDLLKNPEREKRIYQTYIWEVHVKFTRKYRVYKTVDTSDRMKCYAHTRFGISCGFTHKLP